MRATMLPSRYREHLSSTWFTKHNRLKFPGALQGQRWVFVREGLGDFRNGWPPCHGLITQGPNEAFLPWIHHRAPQPAPKKRQSKLRKEAALSSKLSLVQQAQKALIEDMEGHLVAHPLALYPHLEEALPVEVMVPHPLNLGLREVLPRGSEDNSACPGSPFGGRHVYKEERRMCPQGEDSHGVRTNKWQPHTAAPFASCEAIQFQRHRHQELPNFFSSSTNLLCLQTFWEQGTMGGIVESSFCPFGLGLGVLKYSLGRT
jgi:hypothetical protein